MMGDRPDLPQLDRIEMRSGRHTLVVDGQGVLVRGLLGRQQLRWEDVTKVTISSFAYYWPQIEILTQAGQRVLTPDDSPRLQVCIWQHLRRHRKDALITLSSEAKFFWCDIPETIAETAAWTATAEMNHPEFRAVERVDLDENGVAVTQRGRRLSVAWRDVDYAEWLVELDEPATIGLITGTADEPWLLRIPLFKDDPGSVELLLAAVRRLRREARLQPLHIPCEILTRWPAGNAGSD